MSNSNLLQTYLKYSSDQDILSRSVRNSRKQKKTVDYYRFEDKDNRTIVAGATRYNQTGAVTFLPFRNGQSPNSQASHYLTLTEDSYILQGSQLGSAFGYAIEVTDFNNDGSVFFPIYSYQLINYSYIHIVVQMKE